MTASFAYYFWDFGLKVHIQTEPVLFIEQIKLIRAEGFIESFFHNNVEETRPHIEFPVSSFSAHIINNHATFQLVTCNYQGGMNAPVWRHGQLEVVERERESRRAESTWMLCVVVTAYWATLHTIVAPSAAPLHLPTLQLQLGNPVTSHSHQTSTEERYFCTLRKTFANFIQQYILGSKKLINNKYDSDK